METGQKSKFGHIRSWIKRDEQTPPTPPQVTLIQTSQEPLLGDRQRTRARYLDAAALLKETLRGHQGLWGSFDFPELSGELDEFDDSQFIDKINVVLGARQRSIKDLNAFGKCCHAARCIFTASSPFAKNFLAIAREGQQVVASHFLPDYI